MVARQSDLIVHTSSFGGTCCMHGPAYGAGKAAVDKMAHDMAVELRPHGMAVVSIWMGLLRSERTAAVPFRNSSLTKNLRRGPGIIRRIRGVSSP